MDKGKIISNFYYPFVKNLLINYENFFPYLQFSGSFQDPIRKPMLATLDKSVKNQACEMFKLVQIYMSDRKAKPGMTLNSVALDLVNTAYNSPPLRDELFVQICRQTTENHIR